MWSDKYTDNYPGKAWRHKPNHRTESPRREEKKAEPADLEAGFYQSRGGTYGGGGASVWGAVTERVRLGVLYLEGVGAWSD